MSSRSCKLVHGFDHAGDVVDVLVCGASADTLGDDAFFPVDEGDGTLTCQLLQRLVAALLISISTARFFALVHLSIGYQSMVPDACIRTSFPPRSRWTVSRIKSGPSRRGRYLCDLGEVIETINKDEETTTVAPLLESAAWTAG